MNFIEMEKANSDIIKLISPTFIITSFKSSLVTFYVITIREILGSYLSSSVYYRVVGMSENME